MRSEIRGELLVHADWWQLVAPSSTEWLHDRTLDRRVVIRRDVNVTDTRQWWAAIQCSNLTEASIYALVAGCPQLTSVNVRGCSSVTDASISALAAGCPQLTSVDVSGSTVTDASISALARACPGIIIRW